MSIKFSLWHKSVTEAIETRFAVREEVEPVHVAAICELDDALSQLDLSVVKDALAGGNSLALDESKLV